MNVRIQLVCLQISKMGVVAAPRQERTEKSAVVYQGRNIFSTINTVCTI